MSQWTVHLLLPGPGVKYLLQGMAQHQYLPIQDAAPGGADWRVLLYLDLKQILTRQNLLLPSPAGVPEQHRLQRQAFLVDRSLPGNCLGRGASHRRRSLQMRKPVLSSRPIPPSPAGPAEDSSLPEAGKSLEMSGQGRGDSTIFCDPSGQGSATAVNPSGLSEQGSNPPLSKPQLRFTFKKPVISDPVRTPSPSPSSDPSPPCVMEEMGLRMGLATGCELDHLSRVS